ncbi:MAG: DNA polymerase III subunit gamma/tau [Ruminococcus sp.]|nr:DNA polymerase III subunit gamma/tau [Ruminococcus sp.]
MYKALYRKWRPMSFADVISQPHITATLQNQVLQNKTAHAYLFTGSRGTGKTTCARILAKAVNCPNTENGNPCLKCDICRDADRGALSDIIEIDAASNNSVEDIRDLRDATAYMPERCKYKIYIIDEVHMLSPSAWGALLKVMEEPPEYVKFILATTEIHKVPATIISRCQRYDFRRIRNVDISARLMYIADKENITLNQDASDLIARLSDGGMRDAISLLDQCAAVSSDMPITSEIVSESAGVAGRSYLFSLLENIINLKIADALKIIDELHSKSKDMSRLCEELADLLRNLMLLKLGMSSPDLLTCMPDEIPELQKLCDKISSENILSYISDIQDCHERMQRNPVKRVEMELCLIRLMTPRPLQNQTSYPKVSAPVQPSDNSEHSQKNDSVPKETVNDNAKQIQESNSTKSLNDFIQVTNWADILTEYRNINPAVSGSLAESSAFTSGNIMLIITKNRFFLTLLKNRDNAISLGETVKRMLGKEYKILAKCSEAEKDTNPAESLIQKAINSKIETAVE